MKQLYAENDRIREDLSAVFRRLPDASLGRLYNQRSRLTRGVWRTAGGLACLLALLAEGLPAEAGVFDLESFLRFLSGPAGDGEAGASLAMAARHIVRLWDGHTADAEVLARFGPVTWLSTEIVYSVLQESMQQRGMRHAPRGEDRRPTTSGERRGCRDATVPASTGRSNRTAPPTLGA